MGIDYRMPMRGECLFDGICVVLDWVVVKCSSSGMGDVKLWKW